MLVVIRGAGDIATGIALRLWRSGVRLVMLELSAPTAIRRTVCFSQAVLFGSWCVEGVTAHLASDASAAKRLAEEGKIAVLVDPDGSAVLALRPDGVVDAILAKRNLGTKITDAPVVVGVGPGFTAGVDCHAVVETMRGHDLGRVILKGSAQANTGVPGVIAGHSADRLLRAPADGIFRQVREIGDRVSPGDIAGEVAGVPMCCKLGGTLRGLLADGVPVYKGMKCGDVDPRGVEDYCNRASDKALAVGGGVLEALLQLSGILKGE